MSFMSFYGSSDLRTNLDKDLDNLMSKVIDWRHDIHQYPELGNREFRTAKKVEDHLRSLGMKVETKIAYTGVVGILEGDLPGPTIALRADMDALPVEEKLTRQAGSYSSRSSTCRRLAVGRTGGRPTKIPFHIQSIMQGKPSPPNANH